MGFESVDVDCEFGDRMFGVKDEFYILDKMFMISVKKYNNGLRLDEREWECPHCHSILQRDVNAAKNILDEGIRADGSTVLCLVDFMPIGQVNSYILTNGNALTKQ